MTFGLFLLDCLVLCHHDQDRKVSTKSVTMRAMTLCKNLSGYRELLLSSKILANAPDSPDFTTFNYILFILAKQIYIF